MTFDFNKFKTKVNKKLILDNTEEFKLIKEFQIIKLEIMVLSLIYLEILN